MTKREQRAFAVLNAARSIIDVQGEERILAGRRVLQTYIGSFDIIAHRAGEWSQLELWRHGLKVANLCWNEGAFEIATFKPGDWQQELINTSTHYEVQIKQCQVHH